MKPSNGTVSIRMLFGATALAAAGTAFAADLPKEGAYDFTSCFAGTSNAIAFSKTHVAYTYDLSGTALSNPPGGMFDHHTYHCVGLGMNFNGKVKSTTLCEAVDPDGDKTFSRFDNDGPHRKRTQLEGTGKYAGLIASGTNEPMGKFLPIKPGTFQTCSHQTGTYKLK